MLNGNPSADEEGPDKTSAVLWATLREHDVEKWRQPRMGGAAETRDGGT